MAETVDGGTGIASLKQAEGREPVFHRGPSLDSSAPLALEKEMAMHSQCSCLENPRDRGAWWAAVYGVAQSRTRLKQLPLLL